MLSTWSVQPFLWLLVSADVWKSLEGKRFSHRQAFSAQPSSVQAWFKARAGLKPGQAFAGEGAVA